MEYVAREIPLLVEPDASLTALDVTKLGVSATKLHTWMTAMNQNDPVLQEIIKALGGDDAKRLHTDRPRLCIGRSREENSIEVLLIYKNTGGGGPEANLKHTPLVSAGTKSQLKLDRATKLLIQYTDSCVALESWLDREAWGELGLKYSEARAIAAWKRHLVRIWAAAFPLALIKKAGSRTKGAQIGASPGANEVVGNEAPVTQGTRATRNTVFNAVGTDEVAGIEAPVTQGTRATRNTVFNAVGTGEVAGNEAPVTKGTRATRNTVFNAVGTGEVAGNEAPVTKEGGVDRDTAVNSAGTEEVASEASSQTLDWSDAEEEAETRNDAEGSKASAPIWKRFPQLPFTG